MFQYKIVDNAVDTNLMVTLRDSLSPLDKIHIEADLLPELVALMTALVPICKDLKAIADKRI